MLWNSAMFLSRFVYFNIMHICIHTRATYVFKHTHPNTHIHKYTNTRKRIHTYACLCACAHTHTNFAKIRRIQVLENTLRSFLEALADAQDTKVRGYHLVYVFVHTHVRTHAHT